MFFWCTCRTLIKGKDQIAWEICPVSNKPEVCPANLWKLRALYAGGALAGGVVGAKILPLIGFDYTGVGAGTIAAAWQASIGNVVTGSSFAILTSLGMTGYGTLMFGSTAASLTLLASLSVKLDWCTCRNEAEKAKLLTSDYVSQPKVETVEKTGILTTIFKKMI